MVAPNKAIRRLYISEIARPVLQGERSITILLRLLSLARAAFGSCGSRNYARLAGQRERRQTCGRGPTWPYSTFPDPAPRPSRLKHLLRLNRHSGREHDRWSPATSAHSAVSSRARPFMDTAEGELTTGYLSLMHVNL